MAFSFGVITSIGTAYILFSNGVMLGAFITFFYTQDVFYQANKQIWLHGTIEISVIIIAGCAGLIMGNSILFPKTYSRRVSFMKGAKDGLKVVVSTIPFFIIAGFIEGLFQYALLVGVFNYRLFIIADYFLLHHLSHFVKPILCKSKIRKNLLN